MCKRIICMMLAALVIATMLLVSVPAISTVAEATSASTSSVKITTQPKSVSVSSGSKATVTVKASGEGLKYQWYYKDTDMKSFEKASVTKSTYSLTMKAAKDGRQVYCKVTDKFGNSVKTNTVTLKVKATITSQPKSVTVANGKKATVTVKASGKGLTYTWYYKDKGASSFKKATAFTGKSYSISMSAARSGRQVYCVVKDKYGNTVKTKTATLSLGKTAKITTQPKSVTVKKGATAKVTLKASGDGLTYTWYYKDKGASSFKKTTSFKSNTYKAEMSAARAGRQVYCVVKDKHGNSVKSNVVTLGMTNSVKITTQPKSVTLTSGNIATISVKATGNGLTYKWYYKNKGDSKFQVSSSFKGSTYSLKVSSNNDGRQIYCKITDKYGVSVKTNTVTLSMGKPATITTQPKSVTVANGNTAAATVKATGDGLKYQWYYKNANGSSFKKADSFTGTTYSVKMNDDRSGRQVYCKITDKYGNTVKTNTVTLTMAGSVKITAQPKSAYCQKGETLSVSFTAEGTGLTYKWYYKDAGSSSFKSTSTFKSNSYKIEMNADRDGRQVYCVVTDKYGNSVRTNTVTLSMRTTLKITSQPKASVTANTATAKVSVSANGDDLAYQWYYKDAGSSSYKKSSITEKTYSVTMRPETHGRQVYCKVTDKYGNSVISSVTTLRIAATITGQPTNVSVADGGSARTTVTAVGDDLTYTWYYKNASSSSWNTSSVTSKTYKVTMKNSYDGRQVYCVVKDKYGNSVTSSTATLNITHSYDKGTVSKKATCSEEGIRVYTCTVCGKTKTESIEKTEHNLGKWELYREATVEHEGVERSSCSTCSYYKDRPTSKLEVVYNITVNLGDGRTYDVGVAKNGAYSLEQPERLGYRFKGWQTAADKSFDSTGTISKNTTVDAVWDVEGTDTLAKLVERTNAGVKDIMITGSFSINQPIYISHETNLYSAGDYTLTRDPNYAGDIFVVGQDKNGRAAFLDNRNVVLNLGDGKGTLTIDGNRDKLKVTVVGSALYVSDSATVNIYDGIKISNHHKLGNERVLDNTAFVSEYTTSKAGGAAVLILNATVNMYGGVMENNAVYTEYTVVTKDDGTQEWLTNNGCGGAVYNRGNFNMYGGTITGSEALRGGGIYSDYVSYLFAGTISNNLAHTYGGGLSSSSSATADIYIGTEGKSSAKMVFSGNRCIGPGGALYSNTSSPIIVLGNAEFINNTADTSGGAIYTAGPLTVRNSSFSGNSSIGSGGAIYHHYTKAEFERRRMVLDNCSFQNNKSNLGGAVILSATGTVSTENKTGTVGTITNCTFTGNQAVMKDTALGNGGAIYITKKSDATISDCTFKNNSSVNNAGAVAIQSESKVTLTNSTFTGNTALSGGAVYASAKTVVNMSDITFIGNQAIHNANGGAGNGGAMFLDETSITVKNLNMSNNSAATHGGAVYLKHVTLNLDADSQFNGNTAGGHGGAFYLTYATDAEKVKHGSVLNANGTTISGNSAMAGGAISVRSAGEANLTKVQMIGNSVAGDDSKLDGDGEGGGAIYVGFGTLTMNEVTANGNIAAEVGGAVCAISSTVSIKDSTLNNNESLYQQAADSYNSNVGGGAIRSTGGTLTITNTKMDGNKTGYYGGAVLASGGTVTINGNSEVSKSTGATGAALYFKSAAKVTIEEISITGNTSTGNGVVYQNGGTLDMSKVTATGNTGNSGGVLFTSGATTITLDKNVWNGNTASSGGAIYMDSATVSVSNSEMTDNSAKNGGAIYNKQGTLTISNSIYSGNDATSGNGGAVYVTGGTVDVTGKSQFSGNTATSHAGAIYVSYYTTDDENKTKIPGVLTADGTTFDGNTAMGGGAVSIRSECEATIQNSTMTNNSVTGYANKADGDGENGGAIYIGYGKGLTLKNVTATGNTSEAYGGAVQVVSSPVTITGSTFANNQGGNGGAVYLSANSTAEITDSSFTGNTGSNGGAVHIHKLATSAAINNVSFSDNNSTGNAGALYVGSPAFTASNLDFTGNSCANNGGALYLDGVNLDIDEKWTFSHNSAGGHGGAIYVVYITVDGVKVGATLNATDVTFEGNSAMAGGAISARTNCVVNLTNVKLLNNSVEGFVDDKNEETLNDNNGDGEGGGAIYVGFGSVTLTNVTATGNTASDFGGVVDAVSAPVTIIGGTYSGNSANNGGVIHAMSSSTVTITNSTLANNSSPLVQTSNFNNTIGGGAIHIVGGKLTISGTTLDGNTSGYYGGTIHGSDKATVTIDNNSLITNSTGGTGGACYFTGNCNVTIEDSSVTNNTSGLNGVLYTTGTIILDNVTATGNEAVSGGVLNLSGSGAKATVKNCAWSENNATNGGAIYLKDSATMGLINSTMNNNLGSYGGVVYVYNNATLNLSGMTFSHNEATNDGGAIYIRGATVTGADTESSSNSFSNNSANNHGGAIYVNYIKGEEGAANVGGVLNMTGGTFQNNSAMGGGAVSARTDCQASFNSTVFTANSVKGNDGKADGYNEGGGAVYVGYGTLDMVNCTATENTSETFGGAVHILDSDATLTGNTFTRNTATNNGGAVYVAVSSNVTAENNSYTGNSANNGGALYINQSTFTGETQQLRNNTATTHGGAIYLSAVQLTTDEDWVFNGNSAGNHGGALYLTYTGTTGSVLNANSTTFENNTAKNGGAISARSYCTLNLTDAVLKKNSSTIGWTETDQGGGGAIYTNSGTVTMSGVRMEENTSNYYGGAMYSLSSQITMTDDCIITGNKGVTGTALWLNTNSATVTLTDLSVTNNARSSGNSNGAIYATGNGTLTITKLEASGNTSTNGGVMYLGGGMTATIANSTLTGNTVAKTSGAGTGHGGAIDYRGSGSLTITGCTISGNSALNGGAIQANCSGTLYIKSSTLENNTATETGGAIYAIGTSKVVISDNTSLKTNTALAGGAIFMDTGASVSIDGTTLESNTATGTTETDFGGAGGNGGAIVVADTTKTETDKIGTAATTLTLNNVTLKNNTANVQGGAISTDDHSTNLVINATGCTFAGNSTTKKGGGAVELKNGNCNSTDDPTTVGLIFKNCTFTDNTANSTGGAVEIRAGSCAKFDGITATGNTAGGNGAVIYATSLYSRVYLTGTVTQSDNSSTGGKFIHLYNNEKGYDVPPKLYTTHSESADWNASGLVGTDFGHSISIDFGLETLP